MEWHVSMNDIDVHWRKYQNEIRNNEAMMSDSSTEMSPRVSVSHLLDWQQPTVADVVETHPPAEVDECSEL